VLQKRNQHSTIRHENALETNIGTITEGGIFLTTPSATRD
jgi:hypothetical protein